MGGCFSAEAPGSPVSHGHSMSISVGRPQPHQRHHKQQLQAGDVSHYAASSTLPVHILSSNRSNPSTPNVPYTPTKQKGYTHGLPFTNSARLAAPVSTSTGAAWTDPLASGNCSPVEGGGSTLMTFPPGEINASERHTTTFAPPRSQSKIQQPPQQQQARVSSSAATILIELERSILRQAYPHSHANTSHSAPGGLHHSQQSNGPNLSRRQSDASVNTNQHQQQQAHHTTNSASPSVHQPSYSPRQIHPEIVDCTEVEEYYDDDNTDYQEYVRRWEAQRDADEQPKQLDSAATNGRSLFFGLQVQQLQQKLIREVTFEPHSALLMAAPSPTTSTMPMLAVNQPEDAPLEIASPLALSERCRAHTGSSLDLSMGGGFLTVDASSCEPSPAHSFRACASPEKSIERAASPRDVQFYDASSSAAQSRRNSTQLQVHQAHDEEMARKRFTFSTAAHGRLLSAPLPIFTVPHIAQSSLFEFMRVLKAESASTSFSLAGCHPGAMQPSAGSHQVSRYSSPHFGAQSTKLTPPSRSHNVSGSPHSSLSPPSLSPLPIQRRSFGMMSADARNISPLPPTKGVHAKGGPSMFTHHMTHRSIA